MNKVKRSIPGMLEDGNLIENLCKREENNVPNEEEKWKKCKCLGSLVDTENDI